MTFTEEEINILERFVEKSEELKNCGFAQDLNRTLNVSCKKGGTVKVTDNFPNRDLTKSFAITFRLFLMRNEKQYLPYVIGIIIKRIPSSDLTQRLRKLSKQLSATLKGKNDVAPFIVNKERITPEKNNKALPIRRLHSLF